MKRFFCPLVFAAFLLTSHSVHAQIPLGATAATFPCVPSKVLADPARPRIYVADTLSNSILIIDTMTLQVAATVPIGSNPQDMAISQDGSTLYVANDGSTAAAVSILDLSSLSLKGSFALPNPAQAIATGLDNRVYVSPGAVAGIIIYQVDGTTGAVESEIAGPGGPGDRFQISPDRKTLFVATTGQLVSYDVSGAAPVALQKNSDLGGSGEPLTVSHNGKYLCLPNGAGNNEGIRFYTTFLLSATDITSHYGEFNNGPYPGPLTFSPDDSLVYQTGSPITVNERAYPLQVFSTQSFSLVATAQFANLAGNNATETVTSITTDNTGSYLFVAETALAGGGPSKVGQVVVVGTGAGTLSPPGPSVSLAATVPSVTAGSGNVGEFTLTLSSAPFADIKVAYSVKGTGVNGTDYVYLQGTAKVKAGKTSKVIKVTPQGNLGGASKKTVVLTLAPGDGYTVGTTGKIKIKIVQ